MSTASPNSKKNTYVYIDGFNLYFRALRRWDKSGACPKINLKWLDLEKFCKSHLVSHNIVKIKYFTATVSGKHDRDKPARQQAYLRALKTLEPLVEVVYGKYAVNEHKIKINEHLKLLWEVPEEKRTDVNIGAHLINDAHLKRFDTAIVVSNDSDLADVLKLGRDELGLSVGLLNPAEDFNNELLKYADSKELYRVRESKVISSQFPETMNDTKGQFTKPLTW